MNQASARAALTQIINTVLYRLDQSANAKREQANKEEQERQKAQKERSDRLSAKYNSNHIANGSVGLMKSDDTISINESTISESTANADNVANLNDVMHSMAISSDHYKQIYMDILRNFDCEQLNFNLNQTPEELNQMEENCSQISELMCNMVDAICDDNTVETLSIDAKINETLNNEHNNSLSYDSQSNFKNRIY